MMELQSSSVDKFLFPLFSFRILPKNNSLMKINEWEVNEKKKEEGRREKGEKERGGRK
jgi:hypothetical protein